MSQITGVRDLVDYFPVFLNIKDTLQQLSPSSGVTFRLNHSGGMVCFMTTSLTRSQARSYLTDRTVAEQFASSPVTPISGSSVLLNSSWIDQIRTGNDLGVILRASSQPTSPLCWKCGRTVKSRLKPHSGSKSREWSECTATSIC